MKKIRLFIILVCVLFICTACDGDVTRDLRHDGYSYGDQFSCKYFFPKDKDDTSYLKVKYFTGSNIIDENGKIYELSLGQKYSNNENCKVGDNNITVAAIMDNSIIKGKDNKYYYLLGDNNHAVYSEITTSDENYSLYDLLLKPDDILKVVSGKSDNNNQSYYVLKKNGNVYNYTITKADRNTPPVITNTTIFYSQGDFGGQIIDFNYAGDSTSTYVKTNNKIYRMYVTNSENCTKYADVSCIYKIKEDETLNEYKDRIIAYDGSTLITDYHRLFTIS